MDSSFSWQTTVAQLARHRLFKGFTSSKFVNLLCASQFKNNYFTEMCSGSEAVSYLRLIDFWITQL